MGFERDIESDVIEWLEWHINAQSGFIGLPKSYDWSKPRGCTLKSSPTPPDFPKRLRVCDKAVKTLPDNLFWVLCAKYLILDTTDSVRATYMQISERHFHRQVCEAKKWLKIAFKVAETIESNKKREMA